MKYAIVGSRELNKKQEEYIKEHINNLLKTGDIVISGGARGTDAIASEIAATKELTCLVIRPENPQHR